MATYDELSGSIADLREDEVLEVTKVIFSAIRKGEDPECFVAWENFSEGQRKLAISMHEALWGFVQEK
ncbi:MAG: hypothetical protein WBP54_04280 [Pelodictyon phaeoclathratiforme]